MQNQIHSIYARFLSSLLRNSACICICLAFAHCSKSKTAPGTAALTIVNAVTGTNLLVPNFKGEPLNWYSGANTFRYNTYYFAHTITTANNNLSRPSGTQQLRLYNWPDTFPGSRPVYDLELDLAANSVYSLFLTGTSFAPDTVFMREAFPAIAEADSAVCIRFINLSPGSSPISVNISGAPNGSEHASIGYKEATAFRQYPVRNGVQDLVFELKDANTGTLIKSQTVNLQFFPLNWRYRHFTFGLLGLPGGTGDTAPVILEMRNT